MLNPRSYLILTVVLLLLLQTLSVTIVYAHSLVSTSLQLPLGVEQDSAIVLPNQTIIGYLVVESLVDRPLICHVKLNVEGNCRLTSKSEGYLKFNFMHEAKVFDIVLKIRAEPCTVKVVLTCDNETITLSRRLIPSIRVNVSVDLILPSDSTCHFDTKLEKYTLVVRASSNPILNLISGTSTPAHVNFLGYACVKLDTSNVYTVVLIFETLDGKLLPIATGSPEGEEASIERAGIIVIPAVSGTVIIPLFAWADPRDLVGTHRVRLLVYLRGSSKPVLERVYTFKIVILDVTAMVLVIFSGIVAVPIFAYLSFRTLRHAELKEILFCTLVGCLIFTTVIIPGHVLWGIASILGPFDWTVYDLIYGTLRCLYYTVAVYIRPKVGTFTLILLITWLLSTLFFGRLSILSLLWAATSTLFYEGLLWLTGVTRGKVSLCRVLLAVVSASLVDHYVDFMLYMTLYRLYYADWYVMAYVIGSTVYFTVGAVLGCRLGRYLRGVVHE